MDLFAEVIIPLPVPGPFTYSVPNELMNSVSPGIRVVVSFGTKRYYTGIVNKVTSAKSQSVTVKPIEAIVDDAPLISGNMLRFWEWLASYYMCTPGEVLRAAMPSLMLTASESVITITDGTKGVENLSYPASVVYDLVTRAGEISVAKLPEKPGGVSLFKVLDELSNGYITLREIIPERKAARKVHFLSLTRAITGHELGEITESLRKASRQLSALNAWLELSGYDGGEIIPPVERSLVMKKGGVDLVVIKALCGKNIFIQTEEEAYKLSEPDRENISGITLSTIQKEVSDHILESFKIKPTVLLHGVTSSGKTEIYADLMRKAIGRGEQVLYLLPEIGISSQVVKRMFKYFSRGVELYHSGLRESEKTELWKRMNHDTEGNSVDVIIGVRSSVFLPFQRLGLIIVDEEHDGSYKQQDPAPRYNARDAAIMLGIITGARVLLGSATPSYESYYNAISGKYGLAELGTRYGGALLPDVLLADEKKARKRKAMVSYFTPELIREMDQALEDGRQAIIFRNRRGFATMIECNECGNIESCPVCDVKLVYHKTRNKGVCHYCGFSCSVTGSCSVCGSRALSIKGFGTEKLEEELKVIYPGRSIQRIDQDTTRKRNRLDEMLTDFSEGKTEILVGTQMITKGLDFPNLRVVGILNADQMLNFPDFRAFEKSYQTLGQVSGRAGRREEKGVVIIQTGEPGNAVLQHVMNHDYRGLYDDQIGERQLFGYPPFTRLIRVTVKHKERTETERIAALLAGQLRKLFGNRILGPEYPPVDRIKGWYIMNILFKAEKGVHLEKAKEAISLIINEVGRKNGGNKLRISADVDPW